MKLSEYHLAIRKPAILLQQIKHQAPQENEYLNSNSNNETQIMNIQTTF